MRIVAASLSFSLAAALALPARAEDAPATPAAAPTTTEAPATTAEAAPQMGMLSLTSTPAAKVFIDDKDTGLTTPLSDFALAPGKHSVKVVADDGRTTSTEFTLEAGGTLSLNLTLPEPEAKPADAAPVDAADAAKPADAKPADAAVATPPTAAAPPPDDWTWMTVAGWSGLGLGTIGLMSGAVVLTTPTDPDQGPLGFGLFGAGVGMVLGGAVLLYLDNELAESQPAAEAPKAASL